MVVQKYIERPLLVGGGRKFDIRVWVLVSSWNPACVWAYGEPYLRLASRPLDWDPQTIKDVRVHLTNRAVQKTCAAGGEGGKVVPQEDEGHIWTLPVFFRWAAENLGVVRCRGARGEEIFFGNAREGWDACTWPRMVEVVRACVLACQDDVGVHPPGCFELFGFDFMLDEQMWPWLLEANCGPDLCEDAGPSLRRLCEGALTELLRLVVGLRAGAVSLPAARGGIHDEEVPGSGRWRLCLRQEQGKTERELAHLRAAKATRYPPEPRGPLPGSRRHPADDPHARCLRSLLGNVHFGELLEMQRPSLATPAATAGRRARPNSRNCRKADSPAQRAAIAEPRGAWRASSLPSVRPTASWPRVPLELAQAAHGPALRRPDSWMYVGYPRPKGSRA